MITDEKVSANRRPYRRTQWTILALVSFLMCAAGGITNQSPFTTAESTPSGTDSASASLTLTGHTSGVTILAWSPNGQELASATGGFGNFQSTDDTVRLWSRQGTTVAVLTGHTGAVSSLAWSPDGNVLASGADDATVRLWRRDGTPLKTLVAPAGTAFSLAWSPNGRILAAGIVAGPGHNTVQLWKADGTPFKTLRTAYSGGKFYNLGWSPDGQYLVGGAVSYTEWRADGTPVFSYPACEHCTPSWGFTWAPDSRRWAIGNESGYIQIYTVDGKLAMNLTNKSGGANALAWSPDGRLLAGGNVTLWSSDAAIQATFTAASNISALAWSPDGNWLAACNGTSNAARNLIYLWNRQQKSEVRLDGHTAPVGALAWSPDGSLLASGSLDHTIRLWSRGHISSS